MLLIQKEGVFDLTLAGCPENAKVVAELPEELSARVDQLYGWGDSQSDEDDLGKAEDFVNETIARIAQLAYEAGFKSSSVR